MYEIIHIDIEIIHDYHTIKYLNKKIYKRYLFYINILKKKLNNNFFISNIISQLKISFLINNKISILNNHFLNSDDIVIYKKIVKYYKNKLNEYS